MRVPRRLVPLAAVGLLLAASGLALWLQCGDGSIARSYEGLVALGKYSNRAPRGGRSFARLFYSASDNPQLWLIGAPNPFPELLPRARKYGRIWWHLLGGPGPDVVPILWDEQPDSDGNTAVLFYDGHCEIMTMSDLEATVSRTAWLPAGPDGTVPDKACVEDDSRANHAVNAEVKAKGWAYAGGQTFVDPPNVFRWTDEPDWAAARSGGDDSRVASLYSLVGMTETEIRECLGTPRRALVEESGHKRVYYPWYPRNPSPGYDGLELDLELRLVSGRCRSLRVEDF